MKNKVQKFTALLTAAALTAGFAQPLTNLSMKASTFTAYADEGYTEGSNDMFYYLKYSDHISITGSKSQTDNLVIPETIDGLPVTKIDLYSFEFLSIKSVTFPDSLKEIDSYSFSDCPNLTEVTLPANIERLGFHVFENCTSLKTINFPDHLVKTNDFTFENTPWLDEQRKANPLVIVNNAVIDARTTTGDVVVPSGVKYVAGGAFSKNDKVTSVVLPTSVTEIADSTFWMCSNLKSVDMKGAEVIGVTAFGYCEKLSELKISKKLKTIQTLAFSDCNGSANITFYGTENDWKNVEIIDEDNFLKNARITFEKDFIEEVTGDVNSDGVFDKNDINLLSTWLVDSQNADMKKWKAGDLDSDGELTCFDLAIMRKALK